MKPVKFDLPPPQIIEETFWGIKYINFKSMKDFKRYISQQPKQKVEYWNPDGK